MLKKIPVELYSRVVGYYRPVSQWNKGKQEEHRERKLANQSIIIQKDENKINLQ